MAVTSAPGIGDTYGGPGNDRHYGDEHNDGTAGADELRGDDVIQAYQLAAGTGAGDNACAAAEQCASCRA